LPHSCSDASCGGGGRSGDDDRQEAGTAGLRARLECADDIRLLSAAERLTADYDALVETTGDMETAIRLLVKVPPGGTVYSYACYPNMQDGTVFEPFRQKHVFVRADPVEWSAHDAVSALVVEGELNTAALITHRFPWRDSDCLEDGDRERTIKTVVVL